MRLRVAVKEDLYEINPVEVTNPTEDARFNYPAYTLEDDDRVYVVAGVYQADNGSHYAWALIDKDAPAYSSYMAIKGMFTAILEDLECTEVFCAVQNSFDKGERLVKHSGFEEYEMTNDCMIYRKKHGI